MKNYFKKRDKIKTLSAKYENLYSLDRANAI